MDFDLSIFLMPEAWVQLLILLFLEFVLGVDNLVFIAITTDRLPEEKQVIGRRFGLLAALCMRILLLCFASWIISLHLTLFTLPFGAPIIDPEISGKDLILLLGGAYLVYKGIQELREKLSMDEEREAIDPVAHARHRIGLLQAIGTIAVMDIIFSLDSVITAVGLAEHLPIMILAVMIAVFIMIIFATPIARFINANHEVKLLALAFIVLVGVKLVIKSLGIELEIEGSTFDAFDLMLYVALGFSLIITALQMVYHRRHEQLKLELGASGSKDADASVETGAEANDDDSVEANADVSAEEDAETEGDVSAETGDEADAS